MWWAVAWSATVSAGTPEGVTTGGAVSAAARVGTTTCRSAAGDFDPGACQWLDFRDTAVVAPWIEARPHPRVTARGAVDVRLHGPTDVTSIDDTGHIDRVQPVSLRVADAWIGTQGSTVDLRLGAQRFAWGVGQGISVVDHINPYDLEDPTRFDRRLSVPSALVRLHRGSLQLDGVYAPFFVPAALPVTSVDLTADNATLFESALPAAADVRVGSLQTRIEPPRDDLSGGSMAARLRWTPPAADLSLTYFRGYDSIPQVSGEVLLVGFQTDARVDVGVPLVYPTLDVLGLTARGTLPGDLTGWAEVAWVIPQRTAAHPNLAQLEALRVLDVIDEVPLPIPEVVTQDGQPYARWIAGADRRIGPVYLSVQWLHGFPTQRQRADLSDFGLIATRWTVVPTVRLEARTASDLAGWLADAEVGWLVADAVEVELGGTWVDGSDGSALHAFRGVSHVRTGMTLVY